MWLSGISTLTDSTTPKVSFLVTVAPTSGSSTYTTSPNSLCARRISIETDQYHSQRWGDSPWVPRMWVEDLQQKLILKIRSLRNGFGNFMKVRYQRFKVRINLSIIENIVISRCVPSVNDFLAKKSTTTFLIPRSHFGSVSARISWHLGHQWTHTYAH